MNKPAHASEQESWTIERIESVMRDNPSTWKSALAFELNSQRPTPATASEIDKAIHPHFTSDPDSASVGKEIARKAARWAVDDRLWNTQEVVEQNLIRFANEIAATPSGGGEDTKRLERLLKAVYEMKWPLCRSEDHVLKVAAEIEGERIAQKAIDATLQPSLPAVAGDCGEDTALLEFLISYGHVAFFVSDTSDLAAARKSIRAAMSETRRGEKSQT